ncbi:putative Uncharacterized transposase-like protein [Monocercomonoides exilis]|uniref:putative Uncharacterized transposase-like protein n=1 Tax=Monocercomonoides exilis TaxID=2049356 RepID=UPI00355A0562|nr:putative Uncharacterized transposase-like protein [Monocercomonoides exilis]|eukprot:MONOS_3020.1-p1 / transcript=MONOS_3020.1 / gene=MONOS_3020 / organism=Monocercomonoides_exilis_PA203 / gene_product=Uncharacterized transposase-like protein HI1328.1 / transcript_product=Uncharacterized transposase-like protein HI1328.1 / location=Mono_scaffold00067:37635-38443(-) / protein_length=230 / sequence_SO=supercontig / SO=protein_coding / is_pseudo=false
MRTCDMMKCGIQIPMGDPGRIEENDEAVWRRRKYKRGRAKKQTWIFGTHERGGKAFVYAMGNRSASVLIPLIKTYIRPGTEIHSDKWKAYSFLSENGFTRKTVNHSEHFLDAIPGACTNHIEALWAALRKFMPSHGERPNRMQEFIYSFLFFRNRKVDFSIFVSNVMKYSDEEHKALEDEAFGPEEEEEEVGAEILHEEESSESDYVLETDTSSDRDGDGADASEWEANK